MRSSIREEFSDQQQEVLKSIRISRIIFPIILGIGVVGYLLWKQYDPEDFSQINWTTHMAMWIGLAVVLLIGRHLAYAIRLFILSEGEFKFKKCIELVFIWEFSSAVSPTSVGGSAVAVFVLAQEKLSTAKTTAIVLYSAVLDTVFFIVTLPILFFVFGPLIIRPHLTEIQLLDGWGYTFIVTYFFMALYGSFFFYSLFINPATLRRLLGGLTSLKVFKRFRKNAVKLSNDFIAASKEMKRQRWPYHLGGFLATATAWSFRFLLLNCLINAFVNIPIEFWTQLALYSRLETMFVIMAFSPTPGGAGFAEIVFWGFLSDYVPQKGLALLIASIWRLLTYYLYLLAGAIIIPNWIRNIINEQKQRRLERQRRQEEEGESL